MTYWVGVVALYGSGPIRLRARHVTGRFLLETPATPPRRQAPPALRMLRSLASSPRRTLLHAHLFRGGF